MKSALASLRFYPDETRNFKLPASGTPSLLYVFTPELKLGARAYSAVDQDFFAGSEQFGVRLDFWADAEWTEVVQPGTTFTIWYGGDVGEGVIEEII